jgi:hypothetical protein
MEIQAQKRSLDGRSNLVCDINIQTYVPIGHPQPSSPTGFMATIYETSEEKRPCFPVGPPLFHCDGVGQKEWKAASTQLDVLLRRSGYAYKEDNSGLLEGRILSPQASTVRRFISRHYSLEIRFKVRHQGLWQSLFKPENWLSCTGTRSHHPTLVLSKNELRLCSCSDTQHMDLDDDSLELIKKSFRLKNL